MIFLPFLHSQTLCAWQRAMFLPTSSCSTHQEATAPNDRSTISNLSTNRYAWIRRKSAFGHVYGVCGDAWSKIHAPESCVPLGYITLSLTIGPHNKHHCNEPIDYVWLEGRKPTHSRRNFLQLWRRPRESGDRCIRWNSITKHTILFGYAAYNGAFLGAAVYHVPLANFISSDR